MIQHIIDHFPQKNIYFKIPISFGKYAEKILEDNKVMIIY